MTNSMDKLKMFDFPVEFQYQSDERILRTRNMLEYEISNFPSNLLIYKPIGLVGLAMHGKTTMVKTILKNEFMDNQCMTNGISIDNWLTTTHNKKITNITFFDFASQYIYFNMQQCFYCTNCYLIVISQCGLFSYDAICDHIFNIKNNTPDAKIKIIINDYNKNLPVSFSDHDKNKFKNMYDVDSLITTNISGDMTELKNKLIEFSQNNCQMNGQIPNYYEAIRCELLNITDRIIITTNEFYQIFKNIYMQYHDDYKNILIDNVQVNEEDIYYLAISSLNVFQNWGVLIVCKNRNKIIINIQKCSDLLTNVVSCVSYRNEELSKEKIRVDKFKTHLLDIYPKNSKEIMELFIENNIIYQKNDYLYAHCNNSKFLNIINQNSEDEDEDKIRNLISSLFVDLPQNDKNIRGFASIYIPYCNVLFFFNNLITTMSKHVHTNIFDGLCVSVNTNFTNNVSNSSVCNVVCCESTSNIVIIPYGKSYEATIYVIQSFLYLIDNYFPFFKDKFTLAMQFDNAKWAHGELKKICDIDYCELKHIQKNNDFRWEISEKKFMIECTSQIFKQDNIENIIIDNDLTYFEILRKCILDNNDYGRKEKILFAQTIKEFNKLCCDVETKKLMVIIKNNNKYYSVNIEYENQIFVNFDNLYEFSDMELFTNINNIKNISDKKEKMWRIIKKSIEHFGKLSLPKNWQRLENIEWIGHSVELTKKNIKYKNMISENTNYELLTLLIEHEIKKNLLHLTEQEKNYFLNNITIQNYMDETIILLSNKISNEYKYITILDTLLKNTNISYNFPNINYKKSQIINKLKLLKFIKEETKEFAIYDKNINNLKLFYDAIKKYIDILESLDLGSKTVFVIIIESMIINLEISLSALENLDKNVTEEINKHTLDVIKSAKELNTNSDILLDDIVSKCKNILTLILPHVKINKEKTINNILGDDINNVQFEELENMLNSFQL